MKKPFLFLLFVLAAVSCKEVEAPQAYGPVPTEAQMEWQEMEMYAFIHFSINTFTDIEWGYGDRDPKLFSPTELDCRQWAKVCKDAGFKGIIITAKHHDGFCLWPSRYTEYSIKQSPWRGGKGDLVKELSEACKEYGLKLGIYLSPWDRNHRDYGTPEYITYFRNQLRELLTNYGEIFEVWFDGANGGTGYYGGTNENRCVDRKTYYDGRNDEAIKSLAELAAQGHTQYSERVLDRLSSMYYEAGQYEQAAGAFRSLYDEASTSAAKINAASGYVASTLKYADDNGIMAMADDVASMAEVNDTARRKAEFAKAQVLQRQGRGEDAMAIYEKLSDEVRSAEGAESRYRLIEAQYAAKNYDRAEKMVYEFSDSKTPQNYWLAKAFILLGDIYMSRGDSFQARATYQSVVDGYSPADDGIVEEAKSKIAKID